MHQYQHIYIYENVCVHVREKEKSIYGCVECKLANFWIIYNDFAEHLSLSISLTYFLLLFKEFDGISGELIESSV